MDDESNSNEPCTSTGEASSSFPQASEDSEPSLMEADSGSSSNMQAHPKDKAILDLIDKYHTRRATQWALFCWNTWRSEKMEKIEENSNQPVFPFFYEMCGKSSEDLDATLAKFVTECKNKEGANYTPETLRGVIFGLQRFLKTYCMSENKKPVTFIKNEYQYPKYCQAMKKRIKDIAVTGVAKKSAQAVGITSKEEEYLWDIGIFGCNTAEALSNTVFFYIVKIFGIVSSTALRTMKPDTFVFGENELGKYLELDTDFASELDIYNQTSCCHNLSLLAQNTSTKLRHYCNENNPRTFYNILKYYVELIKLVDSGENCLFLRPKRDMVFCNLAIGRNQLQRKFGQIMNQAGLKGYFTTQALVQSSLDNLQVKGYMVRRKQSFILQHQLEISKILDPPPGIIRTYDVKTQTKAILQLVNASQGLPIQPVLPVTQSQLQYVYQVNQVPQTSALFNVQLNSPQKNTEKKVDRMDLQTALQASQNILKAGIQPSTSAAFVTGVSNLTNQLIGANTVLPKTVAVVRTVPTATETTNSKTDNVKTNADDTAFPVPVFLQKAGAAANDDYLNDTENDSDGTNDYDYDNVIIKQEPADYEGECFQTPESPLTHQSETSRKRKPDAKGLEASPCRKIIKSKGMNARPKQHKTRSESNKKVNKDESKNTDEESEKELKEEIIEKESCEAEIEYSFSNDLSKKITKQEVSLKEDGQTMFSFSGTSKMGKSVGDLDINLGDYLPENCSIKPGDIDIKRMILTDGGKMVIKMKYSVDK